MLATNKLPRAPATLRKLDQYVQTRATRVMRPCARRLVRAMQQGLSVEAPGVLLVRLRHLRPQWLTCGEAMLREVVTHALAAARRVFLRQLRRHASLQRQRALFGANESDDEDNDEPDVWPGIAEALVGVHTQLLYYPDAWGFTPLERLARQETVTSRELEIRLQETDRQWHALLLLVWGLAVLRGDHLQYALLEIAHIGRSALAASPVHKRRFLDVLRHARQASENDAPLDARTLRALEDIADAGHDAAREVIVQEQLEQRALRRAEVLMRTLAAQAYALAMRALAERAGIQYMRWGLSSAHPKPDQCDEYAAEDQGYGEGVYQLASLPAFPPHPRCLCELVILWPEYEKSGEDTP